MHATSSKLVLIAADIRSTHNVGSFFRTSDGLGVERLYLCGITPYPKQANTDSRLPYIADRAHSQIHKTALGAEETQPWEYVQSASEIIKKLQYEGWRVCALEQSPSSVNLADYQPAAKTALVVGNEVDGLPAELLRICDDTLEIAMIGQKESFNVSVAAAIGLYWLKQQSPTRQ